MTYIIYWVNLKIKLLIEKSGILLSVDLKVNRNNYPIDYQQVETLIKAEKNYQNHQWKNN